MKKKIIILVLVLVIAIGIRWWFSGSNKVTEKKTPATPTPTKTEVKRIETEEIERKSVAEINYVNTDLTDKEMTTYEITPEIVSKDRIQDFLLKVGMESFKETESGKTFFYNDENNNQGAHIDIESHNFSFTRTISSVSDIRTRVGLSENKLKEKVTEFVDSINDNKEIKYQLNQGVKKRLVYPRWVTTDKDDWEVIEYEGNWIINGVKVVDYIEQPIAVTITRGGKIVKLKIQYIPGEIKITGKVKIPSLAKLKATAVEKMIVWEVKGGENYEIKEGSEKKIRLVTVSQIEPVLVINKKLGEIDNFLMAEGKSGEKAEEKIVKILIPIK